MNKIQLMNYLIDSLRFKSYLEIGLGFRPPLETYNHIRCDTKVGVDPHPLFKDFDSSIYNMTSESFYSMNHERKFDMAFIDGDHSENSVIFDIVNCLNLINEGGVIVLHDTGPLTIEQTLPTASGTAYRAWMNVRNGCLKESVFCCSSLSTEDIYGNYVGHNNLQQGDVVSLLWKCKESQSNARESYGVGWDSYLNDRVQILNFKTNEEIVRSYLETRA